MTFYLRTSEGQAAAYNADSALPRKLKSILKVIDGKTRTEVFEQNLSSFGDVKGILRSLEMAGLIKSMLGDVQASQANNAYAKDSQTSKTMDSRHAREWLPTRNPLENHSQQHIRTEAAYSQGPMVSGNNNLPVVQDGKKSEALTAALDSMSNFVLTNVPEQSFQILKEIEDITSLEILAATLGGYEQMISHLGDSSTQHLRLLKSILRDNL